MNGMKRIPIYLLLGLWLCGAVGCSDIDREALVRRHDVVTTGTDPKSPAQVGNGEFAFGVDITGLQTFVPFNTMAQWGWHSFRWRTVLSEYRSRGWCGIRTVVPYATICRTRRSPNCRSGWQEIPIASIWAESVSC